MKNETKLIHKGRKSLEHFGSVNPPIYQTSTILFPTLEDYENAEEKGQGFYQPTFGKKNNSDPAYGIAGSQTSFALQDMLIDLEGGDECFLTPSGLSAITCVLTALLKAGDHALIVDSVYGPTKRFCNKILKKYGVEIEYFSPEKDGDIEELIKENTRLIFLESPGSLTFETQDIEAITSIAKKHDILTAIDNSWATPLFLTPLKYGVDISIHALTKYINGASDLLMGAIITNERTTHLIQSTYKATGLSVSPQECSLILRGIRSLKARLNYQIESQNKIFEILENSPRVKRIIAPSHPSFEGYENWKKYFTGSTSLFSVELDKNYSFEELSNMINGYNFFGIGASWGGFESLVKPFTITAELRPASKNLAQYTGSLVRYYIGLEDPQDLIEDLEKGFERLSS